MVLTHVQRTLAELDALAQAGWRRGSGQVGEIRWRDLGTVRLLYQRPAGWVENNRRKIGRPSDRLALQPGETCVTRYQDTIVRKNFLTLPS